jgi:hypothetical protein
MTGGGKSDYLSREARPVVTSIVHVDLKFRTVVVDVAVYLTADQTTHRKQAQQKQNKEPSHGVLLCPEECAKAVP